mgnify:CR=1 FL=1
MSEIRGNVAGGLDVNPSLKIVRECCRGDELQDESTACQIERKAVNR